MGSIYSREILGYKTPRVGILSNGTEPNKGTEMTLEAFKLCQRADLNFIGNVEGHDLFHNRVDVVVCDGFVGNVALKASEGIGRFVRDVLRTSLNKTVTAQVGALLSRRAFNDFRRRLDYTEYGGAPLLGVRGVCIIGHGSSNDVAIYNGIRVAHEFSRSGANERIEQAFAGRPKPRPDHRADTDATIH